MKAMAELIRRSGKPRMLCIVLCGVIAAASIGICIVSTRDFLGNAFAQATAGIGGAAADTGQVIRNTVRSFITPPEGGASAAGAGEEDEDDGEEDTRCIHEFTETWVGYEFKISDYVEDYFPGDEIKITASFGKKAGSQLGMNRQGSWYTVSGEGRKLETTVIPDNDYLNIQITDLKGLPSVNLAEIQIEITQKAEEDNTPYLHRFMGPWEGYETKLADYNPDYAPGDEVKISVVYGKDVESQLGMNIGGGWNPQACSGKEISVTVTPDNDYLNIQVTDMNKNYTVGIVSISVEITKKGDGVAAGGSGLMPTKYKEPGDYKLFSGECNEGYGTNDGWLLECADTDWLTLTYDCGAAGQENWGVLGWGTTIDGEWVNGPGYSADSNNSQKEITLNFTVKYLRRALGIKEDTNLGYYSLGAWSEGRVKDLTLHVGTEIPRNDRLFHNGGVNESWICQDIEQILDEPGERYICVQYTCATSDYEGWTVMSWGASVDGEWRNGKSYKVSAREATRNHFTSMRLDVFRNMLHLSWDSKVDSIKLSTYNDGRILDLWISDDKVFDPGNFKKDKIIREAGYVNPNKNIYEGIISGGSGSGSGGSSGSGDSGSENRYEYEMDDQLDEWGWSDSMDADTQQEIIRKVKKGTFLIVSYETGGENPPNLNFETLDGKQYGVRPNWTKKGKAVFSYDAIRTALNGYLIPQELRYLKVTASGSPMTLHGIEVVESDEIALEQEPIALLEKNWQGFETRISSYNSAYQVGDTVTITATFDKSCSAAIAMNLNGSWSAPYSKGKSVSRTVTPEEDKFTVSLGEMSEYMRYVAIMDIQVEIAGKPNYDRAVVQDLNAPALLAMSNQEAAEAAGLTGSTIQNGSSLVVSVESADLSAGEKTMVKGALAGYADLTEVAVSDECTDITLKLMAAETTTLVTETPKELLFKAAVPDDIDANENDFAVARIHDGKAELLPDLDEAVETITFASDRFSKFVILHGPVGSFGVLTGDTSLHTFRSAWQGYEVTISQFNSDYQVGDEVKITAVFNKETKSQVVIGDDWDYPVVAEGTTLTTTVTPKGDKLNFQIQDMLGERSVKLQSVTVQVTKKYGDGAIHVFRGLWQGFQLNFADYFISEGEYTQGRETKVAMTFDKDVKVKAGYNGDGWQSAEVVTTDKTATITITPNDTKMQLEIADLMGSAAVQLLSVKVEQEYVEEPAIHVFTEAWAGFETKYSDYGTFSSGEKIRVTATFDKAVKSDMVVDGDWDNALSSEGTVLEHEISPAEDKFYIRIESDIPAGEKVKLLSIQIEPVAENEPIHVFTEAWAGFETKYSDYGTFSSGEKIRVTATFDKAVKSDMVVDGDWDNALSSEGTVLEQEISPTEDKFYIRIESNIPAGEKVKLLSIQIEPVTDRSILNFITIEEEPVHIFTEPSAVIISPAEFCETELSVGTGEEVTILLDLYSDGAFKGTIGEVKEDELASDSNAADVRILDEFASDEDCVALIKWNTVLDFEELELEITEMEGTRVALVFLEVLTMEEDEVLTEQDDILPTETQISGSDGEMGANGGSEQSEEDIPAKKEEIFDGKPVEDEEMTRGEGDGSTDNAESGSADSTENESTDNAETGSADSTENESTDNIETGSAGGTENESSGGGESMDNTELGSGDSTDSASTDSTEPGSDGSAESGKTSDKENEKTDSMESDSTEDED